MERRRSGLEQLFEEYLNRDGVAYEYEPFNIDYIVPVQKRKYKPDFVVGNIIFETKGRLTADDRKKMLLVKEQHPEYRIIMVFGRAVNTISKRSKTTYIDWCEKNGIEWYDIKDIKEGKHKKLCLSTTTQNSKDSSSKTQVRRRNKRSSTSPLKRLPGHLATKSRKKSSKRQRNTTKKTTKKWRKVT